MDTDRWNGWTTANRAGPARPILVRGRGSEVWDVDGRRYLDGVAAAANTPFGHAHPRLTQAVTEQAHRIAHFDETTAALAATEELTAALGPLTGMRDLVYVNSGSEAIEAALRVTMDYWRARGQLGRDTIIAFDRGYHGCTALTQALSGLPILHSDTTISPRVRHVPVTGPDHSHDGSDARALAHEFADAIAEVGRDRVAAVIVEPFLNVGGGIVLPPGFLTELRTVTTDADTLLIVDEVFTGFGRNGTVFATSAMPTPPDILAISKGMTGGILPMGATCLREGIRDEFGSAPLRYGHTTSGHGLAATAGVTTLNLLADGGLGDAASSAAWFAQTFVPRMTGLPGIVATRSYGVVAVLECDTLDRAHAILARALDTGLILGCKGSALMLTPALNTPAAQLADMTDLLHAATLHVGATPVSGSETTS